MVQKYKMIPKELKMKEFLLQKPFDVAICKHQHIVSHKGNARLSFLSLLYLLSPYLEYRKEGKDNQMEQRVKLGEP